MTIMKGEMPSTAMQVIFVILLVLVVLVFIPKNVITPSLSTYGDIQARLVAKSLATSIDGLSMLDEGKIEQKLDASWNIKLENQNGKYFLEVSHEKFSSGKIELLTTIAEPAMLLDASFVEATKQGGKIKLSEK